MEISDENSVDITNPRQHGYKKLISCGSNPCGSKRQLHVQV